MLIVACSLLLFVVCVLCDVWLLLVVGCCLRFVRRCCSLCVVCCSLFVDCLFVVVDYLFVCRRRCSLVVYDVAVVVC